MGSPLNTGDMCRSVAGGYVYEIMMVGVQGGVERETRCGQGETAWALPPPGAAWRRLDRPALKRWGARTGMNAGALPAHGTSRFLTAKAVRNDK